MITRHSQVLYRNASLSSENGQVFESIHNNEVDDLLLATELWEGMGTPQTITIVLVPVDAVPPPAVTEDDLKHRDAGTGHYVTEQYAKEHPDTTVSES